MLTDIQRLFKKEKKLSLGAVSRHFAVEESAMLKMLEIWIRKGKLKKQMSLSRGCQGCVSGRCSSESSSLYEWQDGPL